MPGPSTDEQTRIDYSWLGVETSDEEMDQSGGVQAAIVAAQDEGGSQGSLSPAAGLLTANDAAGEDNAVGVGIATYEHEHKTSACGPQPEPTKPEPTKSENQTSLNKTTDTASSKPPVPVLTTQIANDDVMTDAASATIPVPVLPLNDTTENASSDIIRHALRNAEKLSGLHDAREYDTGQLAAEVQRQHEEHVMTDTASATIPVPVMTTPTANEDDKTVNVLEAVQAVIVNDDSIDKIKPKETKVFPVQEPHTPPSAPASPIGTPMYSFDGSHKMTAEEFLMSFQSRGGDSSLEDFMKTMSSGRKDMDKSDVDKASTKMKLNEPVSKPAPLTEQGMKVVSDSTMAITSPSTEFGNLANPLSTLGDCSNEPSTEYPLWSNNSTDGGCGHEVEHTPIKLSEGSGALYGAILVTKPDIHGEVEAVVSITKMCYDETTKEIRAAIADLRNCRVTDKRGNGGTFQVVASNDMRIGVLSIHNHKFAALAARGKQAKLRVQLPDGTVLPRGEGVKALHAYFNIEATTPTVPAIVHDHAVHQQEPYQAWYNANTKILAEAVFNLSGRKVAMAVLALLGRPSDQQGSDPISEIEADAISEFIMKNADESIITMIGDHPGASKDQIVAAHLAYTQSNGLRNVQDSDISTIKAKAIATNDIYTRVFAIQPEHAKAIAKWIMSTSGHFIEPEGDQSKRLIAAIDTYMRPIVEQQLRPIVQMTCPQRCEQVIRLLFDTETMKNVQHMLQNQADLNTKLYELSQSDERSIVEELDALADVQMVNAGNFSTEIHATMMELLGTLSESRQWQYVEKAVMNVAGKVYPESMINKITGLMVHDCLEEYGSEDSLSTFSDFNDIVRSLFDKPLFERLSAKYAVPLQEEYFATLKSTIHEFTSTCPSAEDLAAFEDRLVKNSVSDVVPEQLIHDLIDEYRTIGDFNGMNTKQICEAVYTIVDGLDPRSPKDMQLQQLDSLEERIKQLPIGQATEILDYFEVAAHQTRDQWRGTDGPARKLQPVLVHSFLQSKLLARVVNNNVDNADLITDMLMNNDQPTIFLMIRDDIQLKAMVARCEMELSAIAQQAPKQQVEQHNVIVSQDLVITAVTRTVKREDGSLYDSVLLGTLQSDAAHPTARKMSLLGEVKAPTVAMINKTATTIQLQESGYFVEPANWNIVGTTKDTCQSIPTTYHVLHYHIPGVVVENEKVEMLVNEYSWRTEREDASFYASLKPATAEKMQTVCETVVTAATDTVIPGSNFKGKHVHIQWTALHNKAEEWWQDNIVLHDIAWINLVLTRRTALGIPMPVWSSADLKTLIQQSGKQFTGDESTVSYKSSSPSDKARSNIEPTTQSFMHGQRYLDFGDRQSAKYQVEFDMDTWMEHTHKYIDYRVREFVQHKVQLPIQSGQFDAMVHSIMLAFRSMKPMDMCKVLQEQNLFMETSIRIASSSTAYWTLPNTAIAQSGARHVFGFKRNSKVTTSSSDSDSSDVSVKSMPLRVPIAALDRSTRILRDTQQQVEQLKLDEGNHQMLVDMVQEMRTNAIKDSKALLAAETSSRKNEAAAQTCAISLQAANHKLQLMQQSAQLGSMDSVDLVANEQELAALQRDLRTARHQRDAAVKSQRIAASEYESRIATLQSITDNAKRESAESMALISQIKASASAAGYERGYEASKEEQGMKFESMDTQIDVLQSQLEEHVITIGELQSQSTMQTSGDLEHVETPSRTISGTTTKVATTKLGTLSGSASSSVVEYSEDGELDISVQKINDLEKQLLDMSTRATTAEAISSGNGSNVNGAKKDESRATFVSSMQSMEAIFAKRNRTNEQIKMNEEVLVRLHDGRTDPYAGMTRKEAVDRRVDATLNHEKVHNPNEKLDASIAEIETSNDELRKLSATTRMALREVIFKQYKISKDSVSKLGLVELAKPGTMHGFDKKLMDKPNVHMANAFVRQLDMWCTQYTDSMLPLIPAIMLASSRFMYRLEDNLLHTAPDQELLRDYPNVAMEFRPASASLYRTLAIVDNSIVRFSHGSRSTGVTASEAFTTTGVVDDGFMVILWYLNYHREYDRTHVTDLQNMMYTLAGIFTKRTIPKALAHSRTITDMCYTYDVSLEYDRLVVPLIVTLMNSLDNKTIGDAVKGYRFRDADVHPMNALPMLRKLFNEIENAYRANQLGTTDTVLSFTTAYLAKTDTMVPTHDALVLKCNVYEDQSQGPMQFQAMSAKSTSGNSMLRRDRSKLPTETKFKDAPSAGDTSGKKCADFGVFWDNAGCADSGQQNACPAYTHGRTQAYLGFDPYPVEDMCISNCNKKGCNANLTPQESARPVPLCNKCQSALKHNCIDAKVTLKNGKTAMWSLSPDMALLQAKKDTKAAAKKAAKRNKSRKAAAAAKEAQ